MTIDPFVLLVSIILFILYGSIFLITVIFTFFLDWYQEIDQKLKTELIQSYILTPLEHNINWFDELLIKHRHLVGPILILLCIVDIKLSFDIVSKL